MNCAKEFVEVIKLNTKREETWRYQGRILEKSEKSLLIEAFFNRQDLPFHGIILRQNDRFLERYFQDRWYNIFEIHDREDDQLKGWYCNITKPAEIKSAEIRYVDLALDILVYPDGSYLILDQEEFTELPIDGDTRVAARKGLQELTAIVKEGRISQLVRKERC